MREPGLTIGAALTILFADFSDDLIDLPLTLPVDYFAAAAYLLEMSGAYHHIYPGRHDDGHKELEKRRLRVEPEMRERARRIAYRWRRDARNEIAQAIPVEVHILWLTLVANGDEPVFKSLPANKPIPAWWKFALELLMIADEASAGIGFDPDNPFWDEILRTRTGARTAIGKEGRLTKRSLDSCSAATQDIACVQPKSLTPSVGCSIRSLSHHLALLPGRGQAKARWVYPEHPAGPWTNFGRDELRLLLIPFPFAVAPSAFKPSGIHATEDWGWFEIEQTWLPRPSDEHERKRLVDWVLALVAAAQREEGRAIHGVVFPELALDQACFNDIAHALQAQGVGKPPIEFFISGVSTDPTSTGRREAPRKGNFVATAPFFLLDDPGKSDRSPDAWRSRVLARAKHHRWKITHEQAKTYGVDHHLVGASSWWEKLDILSRTLDVFVYRGESTLTTLICEDLARVDPCQQLLRAIGPNLVIALLMDGPQLAHRWPGRYATVLADDPGSSVVTFTSLGLIEAANNKARLGQSSSIGLWKEDGGQPVLLELPRHAEALLLTLSPKRRTELTLDGRSDNEGAHSWALKRCEGVRRSDDTPKWIIDGNPPR